VGTYHGQCAMMQNAFVFRTSVIVIVIIIMMMMMMMIIIIIIIIIIMQVRLNDADTYDPGEFRRAGISHEVCVCVCVCARARVRACACVRMRVRVRVFVCAGRPASPTSRCKMKSL
jgi:hypothetical protein